MSLLCQDYYLHISTSQFVNVPPKRLNVVGNQPRSSLASPVRYVAESYLHVKFFFLQLLRVISICRF